jgi:hypothetical protein
VVALAVDAGRRDEAGEGVGPRMLSLPSSRRTARARVWSASLQSGRPTVLNVFVHRLRDGAIEMAGPCGTENPVGHLCAGHHGGALRDPDAGLEVTLDVRVLDLSEVVPDSRLRRYNIGLVAVVRNDVV